MRNRTKFYRDTVHLRDIPKYSRQQPAHGTSNRRPTAIERKPERKVLMKNRQAVLIPVVLRGPAKLGEEPLLVQHADGVQHQQRGLSHEVRMIAEPTAHKNCLTQE
jgi:hypothetical protein